MKSFLTSGTVISAIISLIAKMIGAKTGDLNNIWDLGTILWPVIVGVGADLSGIVARIKQTNFDSSVFGRPAFYAAIVSGLATIIGAFGYDISGLNTISQKCIDNWPAILALATSIISAARAATATDKITH